jgi:hypothetical protein
MWSAPSAAHPSTSGGDCGAAWPANSPTMINLVGSPNKIGSKSGYWYDPFAFAETFDPNNPGNCLTGSLGSSGFKQFAWSRGTELRTLACSVISPSRSGFTYSSAPRRLT